MEFLYFFLRHEVDDGYIFFDWWFSSQMENLENKNELKTAGVREKWVTNEVNLAKSAASFGLWSRKWKKGSVWNQIWNYWFLSFSLMLNFPLFHYSVWTLPFFPTVDWLSMLIYTFCMAYWLFRLSGVGVLGALPWFARICVVCNFCWKILNMVRIISSNTRAMVPNWRYSTSSVFCNTFFLYSVLRYFSDTGKHREVVVLPVAVR